MKDDRKVYLENVSLEEARKKLFDALDDLGEMGDVRSEKVFVDNARGRYTSEPVFARVSSPHYHASAMDGVAVNSKNTREASSRNPVTLSLAKGEAFVVDTGDPIPKGTDSVIMIEEVEWLNDDEIEIVKSVSPWENVRTIGEDLVATEMIVPSNHKLRPVDIGALLAGGITEIKVKIPPKVGVLPTGDELIEPGENMKPGDIIEYNSRMIAGNVLEWDGEPYRQEKVEDDYEKLKTEINNLSNAFDLVIINAGSSAGREDYTYKVVDELGEVLVHGVAIKPGKPVVIGMVNNTPVIGIPGYPVSALIALECFVKPLLDYWLMGQKKISEENLEREKVKAKISKKLVSSLNASEYVRVKLGLLDGDYIASPLKRGAGIVMSMVEADGIVVVPQMKEGLDKDEEVTVQLLKPRQLVDNTLVSIGSHDITLDLLGEILHKNHYPYNLASTNVGSMGGIMAIARGEAHLAGVHLLDPKTGEYNTSFIKKYIKDEELIVINLIYRDQGFIVKKNNPKGIKNIKDLLREDVRLVNRQRGAGTRVLLDYHLENEKISSNDIKGYEKEEVNHLSVAAAVSGGAADVGLGIRAAAEALDLDFVFLAKERFDLIIPKKYYEMSGIKNLLKSLKSDEFKESVGELSGYDLSKTGEVMAEI
ncbi:molybdopterin biosynthesis protein [Natranaerofaba carboxydovora]|uniref:molybdopterin biosynthesis protein n=1 Tax=Natranaerofaba carboxydovora TaxID=2742683 RepID=UPI001F12ABA1|nr:molybdopterin biosynthesis protein [Natranaerofaba carboxydovora]UMZ74554.1 Molybdopterin molybdenumtransferase [Natranaerofaba carboxydovora]